MKKSTLLEKISSSVNITSEFRRSVLDNGIRIVSERIPYVKSVSLGVWVDVGSRDETEEGR